MVYRSYFPCVDAKDAMFLGSSSYGDAPWEMIGVTVVDNVQNEVAHLFGILWLWQWEGVVVQSFFLQKLSFFHNDVHSLITYPQPRWTLSCRPLTSLTGR